MSSISPIGARWPRILSEDLVPVSEPLTVALEPAGEAPPRAVVAAAARALLDATPPGLVAWPSWLAPHQIPAADRLTAIIARHRGAVLADEVGLGKSYIALAVALARREPFALVVPAVLVPQWRSLLGRFDVHEAPLITHESLSNAIYRPLPPLPVPYRLFVVDEAHRFRNPETNRYRALARMAVGTEMLLITATPIHNRIADLLHLLRLFLRDHALAALGVPSLRAAALHDGDSSLATAAVARLIVARSRARVQSGYNGGPVTLAFPRSTGESLRAGTTGDATLTSLIDGIARLRAGGSAAPLLRLMLLRRLGSSIPAFRAALLRYDAYLDLAARASADGRSLTAREFQRCFPRAAESDVQLILFPLLLEQPAVASSRQPVAQDRDIVSQLRAIVSRLPAGDPKADALEQLLDRRAAKTLVFTDAQPTVRYLLHRLRRRRVAAVFGHVGRFAEGDASRRHVLQAFAPRAQGVADPPEAIVTDVLIATDLLSEGLNLQDAERVVHYDLPWSPARLAQREGRIDRLGSTHSTISTITFLPPKPLADALAIEERLAAKVSAQHVAGSNGRLDWCDQLSNLATLDAGLASGSCAAVRGDRASVALIVRIARLVDAILVEDGVARTHPSAAAQLLTDAARVPAVALEKSVIQQAITAASPLIRTRLAAVQDARWRAGDRDRFARRLIPWVLSAARRAARRGDGDQLQSLDNLVSRLALGMTAGEELLLDDVLAQREPLTVADVLSWHMRLPPPDSEEHTSTVELVAAVATALA